MLPRSCNHTSVPPIRARLKHDTARAHEKLEVGLRLHDRLQDRERYRDLLERFWGVIHPLEMSLQQHVWAGTGVDLRPRLKSDWLAADLIYLGHTREGVSRLPLCQSLPDLSTRAAAFGCLYVLEGSTLGGRVILKMVGRALQVDPERGARFYAGYGERTGLMWMEFLGILEANLSNSEEAEAAVLGAQKTFERLDAWLNQS